MAHIGACTHTSAHIGIQWHTVAHIGTCTHTSAHVHTHRHTLTHIYTHIHTYCTPWQHQCALPQTVSGSHTRNDAADPPTHRSATPSPCSQPTRAAWCQHQWPSQTHCGAGPPETLHRRLPENDGECDTRWSLRWSFFMYRTAIVNGFLYCTAIVNARLRAIQSYIIIFLH